jgi:hypothetical protein
MYGCADSLSGLFGVPEAEIKRFVFIYVVLFCISGLASLIAIPIYVSTRRLFNYLHERRQLRCLPCSYADLGEVDRLATDAFGGEASDLDHIRRLWALDKKCFWKVCRVREGDALSVIGYFCVLRVSAAGAEALQEGTFSGATPSGNHLETNHRRRCRHAYIGAVYAQGGLARGAAVAALTTYVEMLKPDKMYARGYSDDGRRLLKKNGFRLMEGEAAGKRNFFVRER